MLVSSCFNICHLFLFRSDGSCRVAVAVPASVRQVVLFSSGPWGDRTCVNAELNDPDRIPITIGKLTPYNKYDPLDSRKTAVSFEFYFLNIFESII